MKVLVPCLIYAGSLIGAVNATLSILLFLLGIGISSISVIQSRFSVSNFALFCLVLSLFKLGYYVMINYPMPIEISYFGEEGRVFVLFAFLCALAMPRYTAGDFAKMVKVNCFLFWGSFPFLIFALLLQERGDDISHHQVGLVFVSGFVWSVLYTESHSGWFFAKLSVLLLGIPVVFSGSRVSVLILLVIIGYRAMSELRLEWKVFAGVNTLLLGSLLMSTPISLGDRSYGLDAFRYFDEAFNVGFQNRDKLSFANEALSEGFANTDQNFIGRFVMYGKAVGHFVDSPLIGIGPGKFDDRSYCSTGIPLICVHGNDYVNFAGGTAHNAYLHVLAEEGIVGFILFLWLIRRLWERTTKTAREICFQSQQVVLEATLFAFCLAGLYHHVLASPLYLLGLLLPIVVSTSVVLEGSMLSAKRGQKLDKVNAATL